MIGEIFAARVLDVSKAPFLASRGISNNDIFLAREGRFCGQIHQKVYHAPNWHPAFRNEVQNAARGVFGISTLWGRDYDRSFLFARPDQPPKLVSVPVEELNQNIDTNEKLESVNSSIDTNMESLGHLGFELEYWSAHQKCFIDFAASVETDPLVTVNMETSNLFEPISQPLAVDMNLIAPDFDGSLSSSMKYIKFFANMMSHNVHEWRFDHRVSRWVNAQIISPSSFLVQLGCATTQLHDDLQGIKDTLAGIVFQLDQQTK